MKRKKRKERKERKMSTTTATTLQELLQCEEDSFIPDDLDDKFYDGRTYNWEVMFETVKLFVIKEGRWPRRGREEDKRDVVLADGKPVLRDLADWMNTQKVDRGNGKLISGMHSTVTTKIKFISKSLCPSFTLMNQKY